ncbi:hypothetical protein [Azospirillum canadense]|uniref:hypothetical protein n=1 Tax=Azospirillum canadense TaxID=403962 RepID=UPI002226AFEA|nr:hypothetical protein [Azospirillum canadense]MCW2240729.1 hypothetical protein [Azospirillum canadense]
MDSHAAPPSCTLEPADPVTTVTGRRIARPVPAPDQWHIEDFAHGLATLNRYGGQTIVPWSVAQHSLLCLQALRLLHADATPTLQRAVLLHDAGETAIGEIPAPVKRVCSDLCRLDEAIDQSLSEAFDLPWRCPPVIKEIDLLVRGTEGPVLFPKSDPAAWAARYGAPLPLSVVERPWRDVREEFLTAYAGIPSESPPS